MWTVYKAVRRLAIFAFCDHVNRCVSLAFPDTTELRFCRNCGRVISCLDAGGRENNPWMQYPAIDFTDRERRRLMDADAQARHSRAMDEEFS